MIGHETAQQRTYGRRSKRCKCSSSRPSPVCPRESASRTLRDCASFALASGDYEKASGGADIDLRFHFSAMAILALLLGMSLNYVISEAKVLKEEGKAD